MALESCRRVKKRLLVRSRDHTEFLAEFEWNSFDNCTLLKSCDPGLKNEFSGLIRHGLTWSTEESQVSHAHTCSSQLEFIPRLHKYFQKYYGFSVHFDCDSRDINDEKIEITEEQLALPIEGWVKPQHPNTWRDVAADMVRLGRIRDAIQLINEEWDPQPDVPNGNAPVWVGLYAGTSEVSYLGYHRVERNSSGVYTFPQNLGEVAVAVDGVCYLTDVGGQLIYGRLLHPAIIAPGHTTTFNMPEHGPQMRLGGPDWKP